LTKIRPVGVADLWDWWGRRKVGTSERGSATRIAVRIFQATERSQWQSSLRVSRAASQARVDWVHVWVCQNLSYKIDFGSGCKHRSMNTVAWSAVSFGCRLFPPSVFGNWRLGVLSPSLEGLWHRSNGEQHPKKLQYRYVITISPLNSFCFSYYLIAVPLLCGLFHSYIPGCIWLCSVFPFSLERVLAIVGRQDQIDKTTLNTFEETY
jgi:hypothetical protein